MVFKFKKVEECHWVLKNGPWVLGGNKPLILKEWRTGMSIDWSSFESVPVWVKIVDIDPIFISSKNMLEIIGNMVGKPISMDHVTYEVEKIYFARMLVEVTREEAMRKEVILESYDGTIYKHRVEFEWLPWNCSNCKTFGHSTHFCKEETDIREDKRLEHGILEWRPKASLKNPMEKKTWAQVVDRRSSKSDTKGVDNVGSKKEIEKGPLASTSGHMKKLANERSKYGIDKRENVPTLEKSSKVAHRATRENIQRPPPTAQGKGKEIMISSSYPKEKGKGRMEEE